MLSSNSTPNYTPHFSRAALGHKASFYREALGRRATASSCLSEWLGVLPEDFCLDLSGLRFMTNHFNVVAVGIENERRVILTTVLRAQPRRAVTLPSCAESGKIECIDLLSALGHESNVQMRRFLVRLV